MELTNHIIDTTVMKISIANTMVEFDHPEKAFKENLDR